MKGSNTEVVSSRTKKDDQTKPWEADALDRKSYADFLTRYLVTQTNPQEADLRPYCLALDADWGAGKSFFVRNWQTQLAQETKHPSFLFDAWSADYQSDPFIAFMASFKEAIEGAINALSVEKRIKTKARKKLESGVNSMRRALLPVSKAVAKGAMEKILPGAWEQISDIAKGTSKDPFTLDLETLEDGAIDGVRAGLERYFQESLKEQSNKQRLIQEFRKEIQDTIEILVKEGGSALPFFVFVDEIDRCRPSFSISLLEQLKHIFNIPGVCFIISTNLTQLAHAVRGIYGVGFDGRIYLQRFFDSECELPVLSRRGYIQNLVSEYPSRQFNGCSTGLPTGGFIDPHISVISATDTFSWVADAFDLDLRSLKRLIAMVCACIGSLQDHKKIFLMWLTILGAAKIRSAELFEVLIHPGLDQAEFQKSWIRVATNDSYRLYRAVTRGDAGTHNTTEASIKLTSVAYWYYSAAHKTKKALTHTLKKYDGNAYDYENYTLAQIDENPPITNGLHGNSLSRPGRTATAGYYLLINHAGHLAS